MRISDWSSDVCSSDLFAEHAVWRSVLDQKREIITRFDAAPLIFRHGYMGRFAEGTGTAEINAEPTAAQSDFVLGHRRDLEIIHPGSSIRDNRCEYFILKSCSSEIGRASCRDRVCQYV